MKFSDVDPSELISKSSRRRNRKSTGGSPKPPPVDSTPPVDKTGGYPAPKPLVMAEPISNRPKPAASRMPTLVIKQSNDEYVTSNYKQQVFIAIVSALLITMIGDYYNRKSGSTTSSPLAYQGNKGRFAAAWIFLTVILIGMASFRGSDKLAASFAWLIFVASLLINGESVFAAVSGSSTTPTTTTAKPNTAAKKAS